MKIVEEIVIVRAGISKEATWLEDSLSEIRLAISKLVWPPGSNSFTIHPESGKKSGQGNGVRPLRDAFVVEMEILGWKPERPFPSVSQDEGAKFGAIDLSKFFDDRPFVVEWETGNISSSHRSMNKMALGLLSEAILAGVLVVPSQSLARFLTDRIGNVRELRPYIPLWMSIPIKSGYLGIIVVEQDGESLEVPRIKKGTDGRALL